MARRRKAFTGYASEKARKSRNSAGPSSRVVREPIAIDSGQNAHAMTLGSARHEAPRLRRGPGGKFLIPAATVGVMGGAGMYAHRRRKEKPVSKADRYLEVVGKSAVSGPRGKNFPDRVMGATTPMIGQTRLTAALVPTGRHVSHANDYERHTPLSGYRRQPSGKNAQRLLHVKGKGKDRAAKEQQGKLVVATKADRSERGKLVAGGAAIGATGAGMGGYLARSTGTGAARMMARNATSREHLRQAIDLNNKSMKIRPGRRALVGAGIGAGLGVVAGREKKVEKRSMFRTFGQGRSNAQAGFKVKSDKTLRYRAGELSTDRRAVAGTAGAGALGLAGTGVAVQHRKKTNFGKQRDFVPRIGLEGVDRTSTYARQAGRRGARIA